MHHPAKKDNAAPEMFRIPDFMEMTEEEIMEVRPSADEATGETENRSFGLYFRGIGLTYFAQNRPDNARFILENSRPLIQLHFVIRGNSCYKSGSSSSNTLVSFTNQQHNILFFPAGKIYMEPASGSFTETIALSLSPLFFLRYLPATNVLFKTFRSQVNQEAPARMRLQNLPLTPRLTAILQEMLHCKQQNCYKRLYIKAKVMELLALQLEQFEQDMQARNDLPDLKETDIEKMYHARDILIRHLQNPYSLVELAHLVGTNEYYLKKHFKQVFGNTVFGYLHHHRMELAKKELLKGEKKVLEIAAELGYKYATHFTTAFKKHFGYLPQQVKP